MKSDEAYDLLVLGGGMAGLPMAIRTAHKGLETALVEQDLLATPTLTEGEEDWFMLAYEDEAPIQETDCRHLLDRTIDYWQEWAHRCTNLSECVVGGPWHDLAVRSGLVLKLLTHRDMGAIAAAPTTSPKRSAVSATGTTGTTGSATPHLPSKRCISLDMRRKQKSTSAGCYRAWTSATTIPLTCNRSTDCTATQISTNSRYLFFEKAN